mmetsp:Transcript_8206/g.16567  ORF Transcript_8206/g.16567 Transcript_8206/m.16567 type:complete len:252 (+) Transcript_8206:154-909(+)
MSSSFEDDLAVLRSLKLAHASPAFLESLSTEISRLEGLIESLTSSSTEVDNVDVPSEAVISSAEPFSSSSPLVAALPVPPTTGGTSYTPINTFAFDAGEYNSKSLSIYISQDMENVIEVKDSCTCDFTENSFDLKIMGFNGKNYRLFRDNLAHSINPDRSKFLVKQNKVVIKLGKVKGEFSYDHWDSLTAKAGATKRDKSKKDDPQASIMSMMKDMYDSGDDNMRKIIGESMMKSQRGEKLDVDGMKDMDM